MRAPFRRFTLLAPVALLLACGDSCDSAPANEARSKTEGPLAKAPPVDAGAADGLEAPQAEEDDVFEDDWGTDDGADDFGDADDAAGEDDATGEDDAADEPYPGPCRLRWTTGARLRFTYDEGRGTVRIDEDGDKKSDACGSFTFADGRTTSMKIDEGCDKNDDITITPKYDDKANVATATFTTNDGGEQTDRALTLVTIPGFTGLTPGYPLYTDRKSAKVKVRRGLARRADVATPWEGPPMKVTFSYDKQGRVKRIKEDHERDGSTDRRFDYRYDDAGNVTRIDVVIGTGEAREKGRARLRYGCHEST